MVEKFDFKFKMISKEGSQRLDNLRPLNLKKLFTWIDSQTQNERLREQLKKSASAYPHQALARWQKNYNLNVAKAQAVLKEENKNTFLTEKNNDRSIHDHQFDDTVPQGREKMQEELPKELPNDDDPTGGF